MHNLKNIYERYEVNGYIFRVVAASKDRTKWEVEVEFPGLDETINKKWLVGGPWDGPAGFRGAILHFLATRPIDISKLLKKSSEA